MNTNTGECEAAKWVLQLLHTEGKCSESSTKSQQNISICGHQLESD